MKPRGHDWAMVVEKLVPRESFHCYCSCSGEGGADAQTDVARSEGGRAAHEEGGGSSTFEARGDKSLEARGDKPLTKWLRFEFVERRRIVEGDGK